MNIIFFGNTKYSKITASIIHEKLGLQAIVTIPDREKGRNRIPTPNPIKTFGQENNIPIIEANKLDDDALMQIKRHEPDFLIVCDYGLILPNEVLALPKFAPLNVHHSLLPKYRGPSPATSAILAGEEKSGVTIIIMTDKVDAGDILAQEEYTLEQNETTDSLLTKLNTLGAELAVSVIENFDEKLKAAQKQNDAQATHTQRLKKEDGHFDINNPPDPQTLDRMIRAYYPWPTVWTEVKVERGKSTVESLRLKLLPPTILPSYDPTIPFLVQPEGKKSMTVKEFLNGYPKQYKQIEKLLS